MIRTIDVRGLEPPEPMIEILAALSGLSDGDTLEVTHHREPIPLYAHLEEGGYAHSIEKLEEGRYRLRIWKAQ